MDLQCCPCPGRSPRVDPHGRDQSAVRPYPCIRHRHTATTCEDQLNVTAGDNAPDFTLADQDGKDITLSALRGTPVVLYFYPKDDTPGCTTQACGIRDHWAELQDSGARVLGISPDNVASHAAFADKYDLPHRLLADTDHAVTDVYGAWGEKVLYGRKSIGVIRSTVLVDADGTVAKVWKKAQPATHADALLKALADLG